VFSKLHFLLLNDLKIVPPPFFYDLLCENELWKELAVCRVMLSRDLCEDGWWAIMFLAASGHAYFVMLLVAHQCGFVSHIISCYVEWMSSEAGSVVYIEGFVRVILILYDFYFLFRWLRGCCNEVLLGCVEKKNLQSSRGADIYLFHAWVLLCRNKKRFYSSDMFFSDIKIGGLNKVFKMLSWCITDDFCRCFICKLCTCLTLVSLPVTQNISVQTFGLLSMCHTNFLKRH